MNQVYIMGDPVRYFASSESIEEGNVLAKDRLEIFPGISEIVKYFYCLIRRLIRSPLTSQHTVAT